MARCQIKGCTQSAICEVDFSEPSRRFPYALGMKLKDYRQPVQFGDTFTIAFPSKPTKLCYYHDKRVKNLIGDPGLYKEIHWKRFSELETRISSMHNVGGASPFLDDEAKRPNTQLEQHDFKSVAVAPGASDPHMVEDQVLGAIDNGCLQGVINWHLRTRWWSLVETSQTLQEFSDSRLSDTENRILYKWDCIHGEGKTLKDIASEERRTGLTYANVRQLKVRAIKKKGEAKFKYYPSVDYTYCLVASTITPSLIEVICRSWLRIMPIEIHKEKKVRGIWTFNNNYPKTWYEKNVPKQLMW